MGSTGTDRVGYLLKEAQHALRREMDRRLNDEGLSLPGYVALSLIEASPAISNAEIARGAFVTPQSMHRIVTRLESEGLVESGPDATNRRLVLRSLTPRGAALVQAGHRIAHEVDRIMLDGLDASEREQLCEALSRIRTNLTRVKRR